MPCSDKYLRLCPLLWNRCTKTKERTDQSSKKKIQLSDEEIANLSDSQFKALVISMLTEMVEHVHKIEEKVKTT